MDAPYIALYLATYLRPLLALFTLNCFLPGGLTHVGERSLDPLYRTVIPTALLHGLPCWLLRLPVAQKTFSFALGLLVSIVELK